MDSKTKSSDLPNELNDVSYVAIAATLAIKVEPVSSHFVNSTSHFVSSDYEVPFKSKEAVEPVPYYRNCIGETDQDGIASAMKQSSNESGSYSARISCDFHEFDNVSCDVDTSASVTVKIEPEASYLGNATFVSGEASTNSKSHVALPLNDFNGQTIFAKQEKIEDQILQNDIKNEISDRDVLEITSILEDYDRDLKSHSVRNPTLEAGTRKFIENCEESDTENINVLNGTENLSFDYNLFLNSTNHRVCDDSMKSIKLRNCSVLLKRMDITSLNTICVDAPQQKFSIDSLHVQKTSLQGSVSDRKCNSKRNFGRKSFQCLLCKKYFRNTNHLAKHELMHSDERPRNYSRFSKSNLEQHKIIHASEKPYKCSQCDKKFRHKNTLEQHKLIHSGEKPYECSECEKKFRHKITLERHKLIHSGKKPYECSECLKKFGRKCNFERHKLFHSGKKPYGCSECEKKFRTKGNLQQHKLIHASEKPYKCSQCEKKFGSSSNLKQHQMIHSGNKPYECSECEKKFRSSSNLKQHKMIHSGKKPYECSECLKKFRHKYTLERHKHKI